MALKGTKNIKLEFNSMIGEQSAVYLSATIPESGRANVQKMIQNKELYEANKAECRADMAAFEQMVYAIEDQGTEVTQV